jgi:uncharacterized protein YegJ (DUF2314 family)
VHLLGTIGAVLQILFGKSRNLPNRYRQTFNIFGGGARIARLSGRAGWGKIMAALRMMGMLQLLLSVSERERLILYGGGAAVLGALSALLFIVSLFARRPRSNQKLPEPKRVIGPAPGAPGSAPHLEAPEESVVQIDEDDPRMAAAVAEAKKRLPEFVSAFSKAKDGYQFSVKAPFADPQNAEESEFMWVHVCRVDFDAVHGTLLNDPEFVKSFKYDDVVRVPMEEIVDWVYTDGEKSTGDFTARVLDEAAKAARSTPAPHPAQPSQNDSSTNPTPPSNPQ